MESSWVQCPLYPPPCRDRTLKESNVAAGLLHECKDGYFTRKKPVVTFMLCKKKMKPPEVLELEPLLRWNPKQNVEHRIMTCVIIWTCVVGMMDYLLSLFTCMPERCCSHAFCFVICLVPLRHSHVLSTVGNQSNAIDTSGSWRRWLTQETVL